MRRTVAVVVVLVWTVITADRVADWQDELYLWSRALVLAPTKARVQVNFANALAKRGYTNLAVTTLRRVAERPDLTEDAHSVAEWNIRRLSITEDDLQAWFQDKDTVRLPPPR